KHVFFEKPVAVDGPGVRKVLAAAEEAKKLGLSVVCGLQRHHQNGYLEIMKRIHEGAIGKILFGRC
ncbi:MAG: Inositol 2-dehydrogenase, partial [Planctomycetota bacterium]